MKDWQAALDYRMRLQTDDGVSIRRYAAAACGTDWTALAAAWRTLGAALAEALDGWESDCGFISSSRGLSTDPPCPDLATIARLRKLLTESQA